MSLWNPVCSVLLCYSVRNKTHPLDKIRLMQVAGEFFLSTWGVFSLTERTEFTEPFDALFRVHRTPSAYREHRALLPKVAVRFCEIGWLNVSVHLCEICSSVFFCEKKNAPSLKDETHVTRWGVLSLTELTDLTELFAHSFDLTERLRHTENTERYCQWRYQ